jgi:hypothetical protein
LGRVIVIWTETGNAAAGMTRVILAPSTVTGPMVPPSGLMVRLVVTAE